MSDYKCIDPPEDKEIIWLRVKEDAWHRHEKGVGTCIPKNSITWTIKDNWKNGYVHCEQNRYCHNYIKEDFEIISGPNETKEVLLTTIL